MIKDMQGEDHASARCRKRLLNLLRPASQTFARLFVRHSTEALHGASPVLKASAVSLRSKSHADRGRHVKLYAQHFSGLQGLCSLLFG